MKALGREEHQKTFTTTLKSYRVMKSFLIFYLIGVIAMLFLIVRANIGDNPKNWKIKYILRSLLWAFGSWISLFIIAFKETK